MKLHGTNDDWDCGTEIDFVWDPLISIIIVIACCLGQSEISECAEDTQLPLWKHLLLQAELLRTQLESPRMTSTSAVPRSAPKPFISPTIVNFSTAGLGGIMGWCVVHPFNTVCVRMNLASASGNGKANLSFVSYLSSTVKEAGFMSLYAGLSAGLLRQTCYATSRFGLFEVFRDEMAKYRPTDIWSRLSTGKMLILWRDI